MGLDMYLQARTALPEQTVTDLFPLRDPEDGIWANHEGYATWHPEEDGKNEWEDPNDTYVIVGYWRKANGVHAWFVREYQNGVDECQETMLPTDALARLREAATGDIALYDGGTREPEKFTLAPQSGFFFGSNTIDEYFRAHLEHTLGHCNRLLAIEIPARFSYHSSW